MLSSPPLELTLPLNPELTPSLKPEPQPHAHNPGPLTMET